METSPLPKSNPFSETSQTIPKSSEKSSKQESNNNQSVQIIQKAPSPVISKKKKQIKGRCNYGDLCKKDACPFGHEQAPKKIKNNKKKRDGSEIPCWNGVNCSDPHCIYKHPAKLQVRTNQDKFQIESGNICNKGNQCKNIYCNKLHIFISGNNLHNDNIFINELHYDTNMYPRHNDNLQPRYHDNNQYDDNHIRSRYHDNECYENDNIQSRYYDRYDDSNIHHRYDTNDPYYGVNIRPRYNDDNNLRIITDRRLKYNDDNLYNRNIHLRHDNDDINIRPHYADNKLHGVTKHRSQYNLANKKLRCNDEFIYHNNNDPYIMNNKKPNITNNLRQKVNESRLCQNGTRCKVPNCYLMH